MALSPLDIARVQKYRAATEKHLPLEERAALMGSANQTFADHPLAYGLSEASRGAVGAGLGSALMLTTAPLIESGARRLMEQRHHIPFSQELGRAAVMAGGTSNSRRALRRIGELAGPHLESLSQLTGQTLEESEKDFARRMEVAMKRPEFMASAKATASSVAKEPLEDVVARVVGTMKEEHSGVARRMTQGAQWARRHKWPVLLGSMGLFGMMRGIKSLSRANEASKRSLEEQAKELERADIEAALSAGKPSVSSLAFPLLYLSASG